MVTFFLIFCIIATGDWVNVEFFYYLSTLKSHMGALLSKIMI